MKETRVPFCAEMILALKDGRKTETRRLIRPQAWSYAEDVLGQPVIYPRSGPDDFGDSSKPIRLPYAVGDIILGTETWRIYAVQDTAQSVLVKYRVDDSTSDWFHVEDSERFDRYAAKLHENPVFWRPPRYMPKEFVRYRWPLDSLRVERLQDITLAGISAEGMTNDDWYKTAPADWFSALWDSINGKTFPWESNPFVYVLGLGEATNG